MVEPGLGIDELEDSDALEIADRPVSGKHRFQGPNVDDSARREPAAEKAVADGVAETVEQPRREAPGSPLHPPLEDELRQLHCKSAPGQ